jgi:hypothetical protein
MEEEEEEKIKYAAGRWLARKGEEEQEGKVFVTPKGGIRTSKL